MSMWIDFWVFLTPHLFVDVFISKVVIWLTPSPSNVHVVYGCPLPAIQHSKDDHNYYMYKAHVRRYMNEQFTKNNIDIKHFSIKFVEKWSRILRVQQFSANIQYSFVNLESNWHEAKISYFYANFSLDELSRLLYLMLLQNYKITIICIAKILTFLNACFFLN